MKESKNQKRLGIYFLCFLVFGFALFLIFDSSDRAENLARIHFLNVGQGDAAMISLRDDVQILVDAGPDKKVLSEVGAVMPFYDRRIEHVFISHVHADHLVGLNYLLERYEIGEVYFSGHLIETAEVEDFMAKIKTKRVPLREINRGANLQINEAKIEVFWPPKDFSGGDDLNEYSLVFNVDLFGSKTFFTGDVGIEVQELLLGDVGSVEVLKVSHHGSKTGLSSKILDGLNPKFAVISVGEKNRFNHPAREVLEVLQGYNLFRTDVGGRSGFIFNPEGVFLEK